MQISKNKTAISNMFNNIARQYDFLNRVLSLGIDTIWRKRLVKKVAKHKPLKVLDIASGTADLAISMAKKMPQAHIIGADISAKMLAVGYRKVLRKKLNKQIKLELGNAERLKYPSNRFDVITVAFGVRNFEHLLQGLSEMYRVTQKGGQVYILEFSKPTAFPIKQLYRFYFTRILPFFGKIVTSNPHAYRYLPESVKGFPDGKDFLKILSEAGYKNCCQHKLSFGIASIYCGEKV